MPLWGNTSNGTKPQWLDTEQKAEVSLVDPVAAETSHGMTGWTKTVTYTAGDGSTRTRQEVLVALTDGTVVV